MSARCIPLRLDLALGEDPVSGWIGLAGEAPRSFTGYVGLIAELQAIRSAEQPRAADEVRADSEAQPTR
jgi:hypothetical protein